MVIQYRQFGPTPHPRRDRPTQAQLEVGRAVHRQAGYKTGVISTTIPRGPRCPKFLENSEPAQVLPMRICAEILFYGRPRGLFLPNQFGGYVSQNSECKFLLLMWQNRLNYSGSSAQTNAIQAIGSQRTSNGTTHWFVGSSPDSTTVTKDRRRFTLHEGESSLTTARNFYTTG
jgi:hypothetical protein